MPILWTQLNPGDVERMSGAWSVTVLDAPEIAVRISRAEAARVVEEAATAGRSVTAVDAGGVWHLVVWTGERSCRECGCTDAAACIDEWFEPCSWVEEDLCSVCAEKGSLS